MLADAVRPRRKLGGRPIMWKTGHSLIKTKMKEEKASVAGEMSGHFFFADRYYGYDDAIYAALRMLELLTSQDQPLSHLLRALPTRHFTPELRKDCRTTRSSRSSTACAAR